jgi:imidazolonepropionase-like amidohydrolase
MAHCEHDDGTRLAIESGVRTIEHGCFISEETARLMKEKGAYLVPTNFVFWYIVDKYKDSGRAKWAQVKLLQPLGPEHGTILDGQMRAVEIAKRVGVSIGSGTDFPAFLMDRFNEGFEFKLKTECGMTPYEAIKSGTIVNAEVCRLEDKTGSIEVDKWADIIAVDGNPDEDIEILAKPENVKLVMKKGEVFKNRL